MCRAWHRHTSAEGPLWHAFRIATTPVRDIQGIGNWFARHGPQMRQLQINGSPTYEPVKPPIAYVIHPVHVACRTTSEHAVSVAAVCFGMCHETRMLVCSTLISAGRRIQTPIRISKTHGV